MAFRDIETPLGAFVLDDYNPADTRVLIRDVKTLGMCGCDPICEWDMDQEEVIIEAAAAAHATATPIVQGGWQIKPATKLAEVERHLLRLATARATLLASTGRARRVHRT
jgi:hypothetical protein